MIIKDNNYYDNSNILNFRILLYTTRTHSNFGIINMPEMTPSEPSNLCKEDTRSKDPSLFIIASSTL